MKGTSKLILFILGLFVVGVLSFAYPKTSQGAALTSASVTLDNSRFSYRAGVSGTYTAGESTITIDSTDDTNANGDIDTNHLFPTDPICYSNALTTGCVDNTSYTVGDIVSTTVFIQNTGLAGSLATTDLVIASQGSKMTIAVTLANDVPDSGDILVTIPSFDTTSDNNDGIPDTSASVTTNGWDLNGLATGDVSISTSTSGTCNNAHWSVGAVTAGVAASSDHTIRIDRSGSSCEANSTVLTITIGTGSTLLINPAPVDGDNHTQGTADIYSINTKTRDASDNTIDNVDMLVAPIESVLVTAVIDETLSFIISGVNSSTSGAAVCGITTDVTTTATSVPWASGIIASANTFYEAAQDLQVSTNATDGYSVTAIANDQLGLNGGACVGDVGEAADCIRDTACGASACTQSTAQDWTDASTYDGFGYSMTDTDGSDAVFLYNESSRTFSARQFADEEDGEAAVSIMTNTGPVNSVNSRVCYRIAVSGTQPAGEYQNIIRYTATATF